MIKYRLIHNRKNRLKKDGTALIQIELYTSGNRKYISTDISIAPVYWSEKDQLIKATHKNATEHNFHIKNVLGRIDEILKEAAIRNNQISIDQVIERLPNEQEVKLVDFMQIEIEKDERIKAKTKKDLFNTRNKLLEFKPRVKLKDVDYRFIVDLDNYLIRKGYAINTIAKTHKNVKRFLNLAINYGIIDPVDYAYRNFRIKHESTRREALTLNEVSELEKLTYSKDNVLYLVRDMFLFSCYTGLRISDVTRLKTKWLSQTDQGWVAEFVTFKANKRAYLPLYALFRSTQGLSKPEEIVNRYYSEHHEMLFPSITEQKINRHLKVLANDASIGKKITFHLARHTFGTIMASIIPIGTLQELMQHSDIKTTMIYVDMTKEIVEADLGKVNWIE